LRGERSGIRYVVGSRVRVQVSRVDLDGRKIDFRLVHEDADQRLMARASRDKFAESGGGGGGGGAADELEALQRADRSSKKSAARQRNGGKPSSRSGAGKTTRRSSTGKRAPRPRR